MARNSHNQRTHEFLEKVKRILASDRSMNRTIHEKMAFILSQSVTISSVLSFQEILYILQKNYPSEAALLEKAREVHNSTTAVLKQVGAPYVEDFDEWLNQNQVMH